MSSFSGLPLYSISPEPVTRAFKLLLLTTSISPEPATEAVVLFACKPNALISPEPATFTLRSLVLPFKVKSPVTTMPSPFFLDDVTLNVPVGWLATSKK